MFRCFRLKSSCANSATSINAKKKARKIRVWMKMFTFISPDRIYFWIYWQLVPLSYSIPSSPVENYFLFTQFLRFSFLPQLSIEVWFYRSFFVFVLFSMFDLRFFNWRITFQNLHFSNLFHSSNSWSRSAIIEHSTLQCNWHSQNENHVADITWYGHWLMFAPFSLEKLIWY